jgi:hypothetical protein
VDRRRGWSTWEEVDRAPNSTTEVQNFGWPCHEGDAPQSTYQGIGLDSCSMMADSAVTAP